MCKYVLIALIVFLIVLMVVAAVVVQEYGWTGFLIMLGVLLVLAFIAKKLLPRLFRYLLMRPFRQMGAAMQGARIVVHSIAPASAPEDEEFDDPDEEQQAIEDDENDQDEDENQQPPVRFDWYHVEFTVIPPGPESIEGVMRHRNGWSPDYISAHYVPLGKQLENPMGGWSTNIATMDLDLVLNGDVEIWDGVEYVSPSETVFGDQRLRFHVGVAAQVNEVRIVYATLTEIGKVQLPRINIAPDSTS